MDGEKNNNVAMSRAPSTPANMFENDDNEERETERVKRVRAINFAEKIHLVLSHKDCRDAISWLPSGTSFCITNKEKFVQRILPKYFKSRANFNSFERRLRTWGFEKIDTNNNLYIFSHQSFGQKSSTEVDSTGEHTCDFMKQLRVVLSRAEFQPFISWLPSGNSFCINRKDDFEKNVLHEHFSEPHFRAFVATLKSKGFTRLQTSEYIGDAVYTHPLFRIGRPELCGLMRRVFDSHRSPEEESIPSSSSIVSVMTVSSGAQLPVAAAANTVTGLQGATNSPAFSPHVTVAYPIPARGGFVSNMPVREMIRVINPTNSFSQTNVMTYPSFGRIAELGFHRPQVPPQNPTVTLLSNQEQFLLSPNQYHSLVRHPQIEGNPNQQHVALVACNQKDPVIHIPHKFEYDQITRPANYDSFIRYAQTQGFPGQPAPPTATCHQGDSRYARIQGFSGQPAPPSTACLRGDSRYARIQGFAGQTAAPAAACLQGD
eukprot:CCRYP_013545-RA/>CCRYP_013545-RA protein AED:0.13 eAED:0.13 QI:120/1/0.5/1/1/0.5/2/0/487